MITPGLRSSLSATGWSRKITVSVSVFPSYVTFIDATFAFGDRTQRSLYLSICGSWRLRQALYGLIFWTGRNEKAAFGGPCSLGRGASRMASDERRRPGLGNRRRHVGGAH